MVRTKKAPLCTKKPIVFSQNVSTPPPPGYKVPSSPKCTQKPLGGFLAQFGGLSGDIFGTFLAFLWHIFFWVLSYIFGGFMVQFRVFEVHIWGFSVPFVWFLSDVFWEFFFKIFSGSEWGVGAQAGRLVHCGNRQPPP